MTHWRKIAIFPVAAAFCAGTGLTASILVNEPIGAESLDIRSFPRMIAGALAKPHGAASNTAIDTTSRVSAEKPTPLDARLAYAKMDSLKGVDSDATLPPSQPTLAIPPTGVAEAIAFYRSGDIASGDVAAQQVDDPLAQITLEWAALRLQPGATGIQRIARFLASHPDWPDAGALRQRAEELLWTTKRSPDEVAAFLNGRDPETPPGWLAQARSLMARGEVDKAAGIASRIWREADLYPAYETTVLKEFGDFLTWTDHKYRSDRFFYKDNTSASLRAASLAGPDVEALAHARENAAEKPLGALTPELKNDPTAIYAQIQKLIRDNHIPEAANLMNAAPRDATALINSDEWWSLRRQLARKLLDIGDAKTAYQISAEHSAVANDLRIEAEFHAGWIALRFLANPALAETHFAKAAPLANTPISIARIAYWRGRAAEAAGGRQAANEFYEAAGRHSTAFYGQLALSRLGRDRLPIRLPSRVATSEERDPTIRAVALLESINARDLATPLALNFIRANADEAQIAALGAVLMEARDARLALGAGKLASQRGFPLDELAYPTFGVPNFEPLTGSAPKALVYAIARQESAFDSRAISSAGARGLMQMMPATARRTASHKSLEYNEARLIDDPAFNAKLGAAHLGELATEQRGSNILMFAAYNAGGRRVKEWIAAHGDPRNPAVDPVDWIELIPIAETRNYVQRIAENLEIYRALLDGATKLAIEATLREPPARL